MSQRYRAVSAPAAGQQPADGSLRADLSALYELSQDSQYVFASPLGPFLVGGRATYLPRFVFFGPHACDDSWRLAFLAGFDHRDLRASRALVALASRLSADSETGHALNLTFFPVVDVTGMVSGAVNRGLASAHWGREFGAEIAFLEKDARQRSYHGFVTVETAPGEEDLITFRLRGPLARVLSPDLELITSEDTRSFPVRFEAEPSQAPSAGPLTIAEDLPVSPFELTLSIPGTWSDEAYQHAAVTLLDRFLQRYRAFQAYGQNL
jgi:hypothetical protein